MRNKAFKIYQDVIETIQEYAFFAQYSITYSYVEQTKRFMAAS